METRNIEIHTFSLFDSKTKERVKLNDINGVDLLDVIFEGFVKFIDSFPVDEHNKRVVNFYKENDRVLFRKSNNKRLITGKIETGRYGKEENVKDVNHKENGVAFKIYKNHAVQKPFFFMISVPENKDKGFILLEREGQYGIKEIFVRLFKLYLKSFDDYYWVRFENFIDKEVVNNYINNGEYNSISVTRNSLPAEVSDRYGLGKFDTDDFTIELKIKAKSNKKISGTAKQRIKKIFENKLDGFFVAKEFDSLGFDESSKIKVNSTYRNSPRTIDLGDTMKFRPYYEINVEINDKGHSEFGSIQTEAIELLNEFNLDIN